jgi:thymidylate kinase
MFITVEGMNTAGISTTTEGLDMEELRGRSQQNMERNMSSQF